MSHIRPADPETPQAVVPASLERVQQLENMLRVFIRAGRASLAAHREKPVVARAVARADEMLEAFITVADRLLTGPGD